MNDVNANGLYMSPAQAHLGTFSNEYTPDVDYLDNDFDFENTDLGGDMIGALPGAGADSQDDLSNGFEQHEKRKSPEEADDKEQGDAKRQETGDGEKGSRKPGRKPLTSEPTTKRKAQNRAAQRAFRERKEQHLKDLETKVTELTKAHESDKQENSQLKLQMERMQVELKEYRKRLSLNGGSGSNGSPPLGAHGNRSRRSSYLLNHSNDFNFDFPRFGALPGSQIFGSQSSSNGSNSGSLNRNSNTPPSQSPTTDTRSSSGSQQQSGVSRKESQARDMSPKNLTGAVTGSPSQMPNQDTSSFNSFSTANNMHGFASTLPQMVPNPNDPFGDLFSPGILKSASVDSTGNYFPVNAQQLSGSNLNQFNSSTGGESTAGLNRVFKFNSNGSTSDSASPSNSSGSQWNANAITSSCDTSPEPSHNSPAEKIKDGETFCDKINPINPSQRPLKQETGQSSANSIDPSFFNSNHTMPSNDTFDPVLFGDYRDTNDGFNGGDNFNGSYFDDALNPQAFDFGSPSNLFGILNSPEQQHTGFTPNPSTASAPTPCKNLMAQVEKTCQGGDDDYGLPNSKHQQQQNTFTGDGNMISCNNIWTQLQSNPDFQEGKFDLDGLCSELRQKARCSETGVMVDQDHVDAALRKLGTKDEKATQKNGGLDPRELMFEQKSWENVLKKLQGGGQGDRV